MKRTLIITIGVIVVGGLALVGAYSLFRGPTLGVLVNVLRFLGTPIAQEDTGATVEGPSFTEDRDSDGLSDAKEEIYGTNSVLPDTDGDNFTDGAEVRKGFDPKVAGQGKIADNPELMRNLTIAYFEWARETSNIEDPQLAEQGIQTFLISRKQDRLILPTVEDNEIVRTDASGPDAVKAYLDAFAQVTLPPVTASYLDLAEGSLQEETQTIIDTVVLGIDATYEQIRRIPTPQEAIEVQRGQLATMKALKELFLDLKSVRRDPVKLIRDISWGNELVLKSADIEKKRQELGLITNPAFQNSNQGTGDSNQ
ncbi:MAG: hypothetical protein A3A30_02840 [Candidatus Terrybacteria bacterium RIFCSPLOWO2_01_FULL_48_14]|nr:MAG: hypothetical protein A3A30_02840 [Candidatus Terrybacteria bacterium RIFCSPLOWO2_01_FULL_48_14]